MSILVRFNPSSMTAEQYDGVTDKLQSGSSWPPDGMQLHVCFGSDGSLKVSEVWESKEKMEKFGETLMPILSEAGIEMGSPPEFLDVHSFEVMGA
jgi:hypothetical protein